MLPLTSYIAQERLPFLEGIWRFGVPRVETFIVGPDYLIQGKFPFPLIPKREADVVRVVAGVDFEEVAFHAESQVAVRVGEVGWVI